MLLIQRQELADVLKRCLDAVGSVGASSAVHLSCAADGLSVLLQSQDVICSGIVRCGGDSGRVAVEAGALLEVVESLRAQEIELLLPGAGGSAGEFLELRAPGCVYREPALTEAEIGIPYRKAKFRPLDPEAFRTVLRVCASAASRDLDRPHLNGIWLEFRGHVLRGVGVDGHRAQICNADLEEVLALVGPPMRSLEQGRRRKGEVGPVGCLVALRGALAIARVLENEASASIAVRRGWLLVRTGNGTVAARLVDARFPPYYDIVPVVDGRRHGLVASIESLAFSATLRRLALVGRRARGVVLATDGTDVRCVLDGAGRSLVESVPCQPGGFALHHGVNPVYLADAVDMMGSERVSLYVGGLLDPFLVAPSGQPPTLEGNRLAIVMPMRLF